MNYCKIYESLIHKGKSRNEELPVFETHHILPRCIGGSDNVENLVRLTPEEHYLAHLLLVKMYPGEIKLVYAANIMSGYHSNGKVTNKSFGWIRRRLSNGKKGVPRPLECVEKMKRSLKGRKLSEDHKKKIGISGTGKKRSEETRRNISLGNTGKTWSIERRLAKSESMKGKPGFRKGMTMSEESKKKLSESQKMRHRERKLKDEMVRKSD